MTSTRPLLVTGATGYIGGRLVPRLLASGHRVRCLVRAPGKLADREWVDHDRVEIVAGDAGDPRVLGQAMAGCRVAYYLIHSMMAAGASYRVRDQELAAAFAAAASDAGLERIVYLGGLGETGADLSEHLSSRREVEDALASGSVPVTVLRAAMIIGSGSASFEILRYLVERLPVMITPSWVRTECQPIGVRDVLHYLEAVLDTEGTEGRTLDIGGPNVVTYRRLMEEMALALGLARRWIISVPVLTPRLSSLWIHLVTPLSHRIARPLAEGMRNRVVCRDDAAQRLMPGHLQSVREAMDAALGKTRSGRFETVWSGAGPIPGDPEFSGGKVFIDRRELEIDACPEIVFRAVCRIGGGHGWYASNWLWRIRGRLDRLVGGPGLRRLRRDPERVCQGETLDFWRVTGIEPGRRLTLGAEMKLPGEAELEFAIEDLGGRSRLCQTARFKPRGLAGLVYWIAVLPLHGVVFRGMINGVRRMAESLTPEAAKLEVPE